MGDLKQLNIKTVMDQATVGAYRLGIFMLCGLIAMVDGFDTQSIAFAAPAIATAWQVSPSQFGIAFGAALFGALFGGACFGPLGDRWGRRPILIVSMMLFACASYGSAHSETIQTLTVWRFITGLGLGGAIPCLIAITSEYSPTRLRATIVTAMFCGFPIGAIVGGIVSAKLIEIYSWTAIFTLGAALPLILLPFVFLFLPESPSMIISRKRPHAEIRTILEKITRRQSIPSDVEFIFFDQDLVTQARPQDLFRPDLWLGSVLIGVLFFSTLMLSYFLVNWTPLLLRQFGFPIQVAIYGTVLMNAGGILGGLLISRLTDRLGIIRILPVAYVVGGVAVALIGVGGGVGMTLTAAFLAGLLCIGAQLTAIGVIALFYPPELCATGVGWTMAVGRVGSFLGPVCAGFLISAGFSMSQLFWIAAIPATVAAASVLGVGLAKERVAKQSLALTR